jgi:hypothetical protein
MRDEDYLKNLGEIAKWLDSLIVEVSKINETVEDLIAEAPVSIAAWDKVGDEIWNKHYYHRK